MNEGEPEQPLVGSVSVRLLQILSDEFWRSWNSVKISRLSVQAEVQRLQRRICFPLMIKQVRVKSSLDVFETVSHILFYCFFPLLDL